MFSRASLGKNIMEALNRRSATRFEPTGLRGVREVDPPGELPQHTAHEAKVITVLSELPEHAPPRGDTPPHQVGDALVHALQRLQAC